MRISPPHRRASSKRIGSLISLCPHPTLCLALLQPHHYIAHDVCTTNNISHASSPAPLYLPPSQLSDSHAYSPPSLYTLLRVSHSRMESSMPPTSEVWCECRGEFDATLIQLPAAQTSVTAHISTHRHIQNLPQKTSPMAYFLYTQISPFFFQIFSLATVGFYSRNAKSDQS